jgi:chromosome segregation ATPase
MERDFLTATLELEKKHVDAIMREHGKTIKTLQDEIAVFKAEKQTLESDKAALNGKLATFESDLKAAKDETAKLQSTIDEANADTWKTRAETAEKALAVEKEAHEATKNDYATKEENAAKDSILAEAIKTAKTADGEMLKPTQVGLALKILDKESVKWEKKGDTFNVKNLDEIIAELAKTEGLEFAKQHNVKVQPGAHGGGEGSGKNPWLKESRNLAEQTRIYRENPVLTVQMAKRRGNHFERMI